MDGACPPRELDLDPLGISVALIEIAMG